jgi:predicted nucleic acid-binding protein
MSSRSSPKDVAALPSGSRVFIDANIFIYHFTHTPLTAACTKFLQRVEVGDIEGITSVITLAEVAHRLMILEAIQIHGLFPHAAVRKLKENPTLVQQLSHITRS